MGCLGVLAIGDMMTITTATAKRQSPLEVDAATDDLISQAAHFLGIFGKEFVPEASWV